MTHATRVCADCSADISSRHWNAKRCAPCTTRRSKANRGKPRIALDRVCVTCGSSFTAKRVDSLCCSRACTVKRLNGIHNGIRRVQHEERTCPTCGVRFKPPRSDSVACSLRCSRKMRYEHAPVWHEKSCDVCGKAFTSKRSDARRCSSRCNKMHYYLANRDELIAAAALWGAANRAARKLIAAKYKARRRGWEGEGPGVSLADWTRTLNRFRHRCAYCDTQSTALQMDHVVPLSRGGSHAIGNVVPACPPCNLSKNAKFLVEWKRR